MCIFQSTAPEDPAVLAVDALSIKWQGYFPHMFPQFVLIPPCLEKLRHEKVSAVLIIPVWPNQVWFPQLLWSLIDYPVVLPPTQDTLTDPEGHSHPMIVEGHLPLAMWLVSGNPGSLKDFQMELLPSSGIPGDFPRNQPTQVPGIVCWCAERNINPLSAPVRDILEFLLSQFETGKQNYTITIIRSAISMTHKEIDGVPVGQHLFISCFLKGFFNLRPPAPRYSMTWDVDVVLSHIRGMEDNDELSFKLLPHKLVMPMAFTNADRCFDIDLTYQSYQENRVNLLFLV